MTAGGQPSLKTTIAGIELSTCIYNASGPRSGTAAALSKICQSASGGVLAKSATIEKQTGNPQPRTWHDPKQVASMNSEGLPNNGIDYYISEEVIAEAMGEHNKPYMVSISGKTLQDNLEMLKRIISKNSTKIKAVELNLACPNVIGKPIIAYDFEQMDMILRQVTQVMVPNLPLGLKLPPYLDGLHFQQAADILNKYQDQLAYVATMNTLGNALAIDVVSEAPKISSNQGFAGLSGAAVKYTALANVCKLRKLLSEKIDVVGVGGVHTGTDAFELILCGAKAVQVGTCHWTEGPACFDRICKELQDIMKEKGYTSIDDFCGKLKPWSKEGAAKSREAAKQQAPTAVVAKKERPETPNDSLLLTFLVVAVAILLADKFSGVKILP